MTIPQETLQAVGDLYGRGLYLQAYRAAVSAAPLRDWTGPEGRTLAGRLAGHLGAPRLGLWHRLKAWREAPEHPAVRYYYAWALLEGKGPYATWRFLQERGDMPGAPGEVRASWYSLHAQVSGSLRDFDLAERWLDRAREAQGDRAWVEVAASFVREREDRYEDALAAADESLRLHPWFRPAVQARGHLLTLLGRDEEAFTFLSEAAGRLECAAIYLHLAGIEFERENFAAVEECLRKFKEMSPLLEGHFGRSFYGLRSFLAYRRGDDEAAVAWARRGEGELDRKIVERLSDPARRGLPRVLLPVGFTRQHHLTCVPATLATIGRYWSMPAEHLRVAEEICYDGTSSHAERHWAAENGWLAREFTVTEPAARRLVDAGVPFTLTTVEPGGGHLQAVVGYDARRGSLILRDPYHRQRGEVFADTFLERYAAFGPRGMALVPRAEAGRLSGIDLPDADRWDRAHEIEVALAGHRREDAVRAVEVLRRDDPRHRLTLQARVRLASYDANPAEELAATEDLLRQFPDNDVLRFSRLALLRHLARPRERREALAALCEASDAHPRFVLQYAQELAQDAREHDRAVVLLQRTVRALPSDAGGYYLLANVLWDRLRFDEALELYRFAASLDDKDEQLADSYFRAAQHCRRTEEALAWLRRRFERFGRRSGLPARTLSAALTRLERTGEALDVLEEALRLRPGDGELRLHAAGAFAAASGEHADRARQMLDEARGRCPEPQWLRVAARMASARGESSEALRLYRAVLDAQPLALDAHSAVAQLLAETEGRAAALAHLREAVGRFPHHQPLLESYAGWLRDEPAEEAERVVRGLIELNPTNAWAVRELGFLLLRQGRLDEAEACADEAGRLEPTNASRHHLRGELLAARGRTAEARAAYRDALRLSVDNGYAMHELLSCCDHPAERREELEFLRQELQRQVLFGDGLLAYRSHAQRVLDPDELLGLLREALQARPDLWHAWSACVRQLAATGRLDEAEELARRATERFPLLPRLWLDLAEVRRLRGNEEAQLAALESARRVNPSWAEVLRQLSEIHLRRGDLERSRALLESAVTYDPLDAVSRGFLAEVLCKRGEHAAAVEQIERAVTLEPGYDWAWGRLAEWAEQAGRPELPEQAARALAAARPGEARSWLMLARVLDAEERFDSRLEALRKAAEVYPRCVEAYGRQAQMLAGRERYDEALAACRPPVWGDQPPPELAARAAWVEWSRGRREEAVARMRLALEADPGMAGGWQMLADWLGELGDNAGCLEAARAMVRIGPHEAVPLGYLGDALQKNGSAREAKAAFRRAFEIDPDYGFAGIELFDLQLADRELDEAAETLARLRWTEDSPFQDARAVSLAARRGDRAAAVQSLRAVCLAGESENDWPLRTACGVFHDAGWLDAADEVLSEAVEHPDVDPEAGAYWADLQLERGNEEAAERLRALVGRGRVGERAVYGWVAGLVRLEKHDSFRRFVRRHGEWLRANARTWGAVCYGWTSIRDWKQGLQWVAPWRDHPEAEPWMLVNVAEMLRAAGRDAEAADASRYALTLPGHGRHLHLLWLATDDIVAGRPRDAAEKLREVDQESLDEDYRVLDALCRHSIEIATADPAERRATFARVRGEIDRMMAGYTMLSKEPARRRFYLFCLGQIARQAGGPRARLWGWWRRLAAV